MRISVEDFKLKFVNMKPDGRFPIVPIIFEDLDAFRSIHRFLMETTRVLEFKKTLVSTLMDPVLKLKEVLKSEEGTFYIPWAAPLLWLDPGILLRFYNLELPNHQVLVYLPILGLDGETLRILNDIVRREKLRRNSEPIWVSLNESRLIVESFNSFNFKNIPTTVVEKLLKRKEELLEYFENRDIPDRISIAFPLKANLAFGVKYVEYKNVKEFLERAFDFRVPIDYNESESDYWKELAEDFLEKHYTDFIEYSKRFFNVLELNFEIFEKWDDDYSSWVIYALLREKTGKFGCLEDLALETDSFQSFLQNLWMMPFKKHLGNDCLKIRRRVLKNVGKPPPEEFLEKLKETDEGTFTRCAVGTESEKPVIVEKVGEMIKNNGFELPDGIFEFLNEVYPELSNYLGIVDLDVPEYFKDYVLHKIADEFDLGESIDISEYGSRDGKLNSFGESVDIFYVDGMGLEWLGFVLKELKNYVVDFEIAQANPPTISKYNTIRISGKEVKELSEMIFSKRLLDETLHEERYPERIVESLKIMKDLMEIVVRLLKEKKMIVLTSDHGFTAHLLDEKVEPPENDAKIQYSGRIALVKDFHEDTEDYMYCETHDGNRYAVMKNNKLFKGSRKPSGETHGGWTPEEVLVPILRLSINPDVEFHAELVSGKIRKGRKLKIRIYGGMVFKVIIHVLEDDVEIVGRKTGKDIFEFDTRKLKSGKKNFDLIVNGKFVGSFRFEVISGFEEEDLFDGEI